MKKENEVDNYDENNIAAIEKRINERKSNFDREDKVIDEDKINHESLKKCAKILVR